MQLGKASEPELMQKIVSLCKRRGFVFQSSEIYGGLKSCYDYGPLGAELKRNVKNEWWRAMVHEREDIVGIDASIIMHPKVWEASGHLAGFTDPLVDCKNCKARFRPDKAPAAKTGEVVEYALAGPPTFPYKCVNTGCGAIIGSPEDTIEHAGRRACPKCRKALPGKGERVRDLSLIH
ncbi:MAG: hypothetical protein N3A38_04110, partial [Planctomycetota bacterium]|nr:hypothetical protein [Planctomycetota bacterium]